MPWARKSRRGTTIGLLPGEDRDAANGWVDVAIATGLGEMRNGLIVRATDAVIAIGGGAGTLSEIALALRTGRPVGRDRDLGGGRRAPGRDRPRGGRSRAVAATRPAG